MGTTIILPPPVTAAQFPLVLSSHSVISSIANTETVIPGLSASIAANTLSTTSLFRFMVEGDFTSAGTPGTGTWRIRFGPVALTGAIVHSQAFAQLANCNNVPWGIICYVAVQTIGATGTMQAHFVVNDFDLTGVAPATMNGANLQSWVSTRQAAGVVDTTATSFLSMTYISGNASSHINPAYASLEQIAA